MSLQGELVFRRLLRAFCRDIFSRWISAAVILRAAPDYQTLYHNACIQKNIMSTCGVVVCGSGCLFAIETNGVR